MKFYESHYDEYIASVDKYNLHPELSHISDSFEPGLSHFDNLIVYGPAGIGKYSQILYLLKKYSPTKLKYDKKITINTEKQQYTYHISDIHYEIDMSLLGCNSKILWHELFFQIVDIISVKQEKIGVILCKNFHMIHNELLEIFYSYIQQYRNHATIQIKFIIMTEHLSFMPNNILNSCKILSIGRPAKEAYMKTTENSIMLHHPLPSPANAEIAIDNLQSVMTNVAPDTIINTKEIRSFVGIDKSTKIPEDIFNIICDNIIHEIMNPAKINFAVFRDVIYDILIYNLDVSECIWYILNHLIQTGVLPARHISGVLNKIFTFLKYYNNNYRPIYHLESILFYLIVKIHNYNEL